MTGLVWAYLAWNAACLFVMAFDKLAAKRHARRVPERTLLGAAFCMGACGIWAGMKLFRHKTRHGRFVYGMPLAMAINAAVIYLLVR